MLPISIICIIIKASEITIIKWQTLAKLIDRQLCNQILIWVLILQTYSIFTQLLVIKYLLTWFAPSTKHSSPPALPFLPLPLLTTNSLLTKTLLIPIHQVEITVLKRWKIRWLALGSIVLCREILNLLGARGRAHGYWTRWGLFWEGGGGKARRRCGLGVVMHLGRVRVYSL